MGHDSLSIKVNRIFVSSEGVGPEAEVTSFELTATMSSEHYLKEKLERMWRLSGQIKIKCIPLDLFVSGPTTCSIVPFVALLSFLEK